MSHAAISCAPGLTPASRFKRWLVSVGPFWAASIAGHLILLIVLALVWGSVHVARTILEQPVFQTTLDPVPPETLCILTPPPTDPEVIPELNPLILEAEPLVVANADESSNAMASVDAGDFAVDPFARPAGMTAGNFSVGILGSNPRGPGDGSALRTGIDGDDIKDRFDRKKDPGTGITKATERSVASALNWLIRHQRADGSWRLDPTTRCHDSSCTHIGSVKSDAAATSLALLPFLAAGITSSSKSIVVFRRKNWDYSRTVAQGLAWLVGQQREDGNLADGPHVMYTHGLATITLCEAYAMNSDQRLGDAAQAAVRFIERAQNKEDGGWRYTPGAVPGDTSVVGWQVMAVKSAQLAGLAVSPETLAGVKRYLQRASVAGRFGGVFSYMPDDKAGRISMTAVGMLCNQYVGLERNDPAMIESTTALLRSLPSRQQPDIYYWYYATQAMHNMSGPEWDAWNRAMRRVLVETQTKEGCAAGSWSPDLVSGRGHVADAGGRLMATSLAALSLEVYYRHLPLYKIGQTETAQR